MVRPLPKLEPHDDAARSSLLSTFNPLRIALSVVRGCVVYLFPPATSLRIASHIVPLLVCLSLIPLVLFFSLFSGWYIWKNIPVAWQVPIYLQYGSVFPPFRISGLVNPIAAMAPHPMQSYCYLLSPLLSPMMFPFIWSCQRQRQISHLATSWLPLHFPRLPIRPL